MQASWNAVLESHPESAGRTLTLSETYSLMGHTGEEIAAYTLPRLSEKREHVALVALLHSSGSISDAPERAADDRLH